MQKACPVRLEQLLARARPGAGRLIQVKVESHLLSEHDFDENR
jgi:hypothetical protein